MILMSVATERYYTLNGIAAEIWMGLCQGRTTDIILAEIVTKYEVTDAVASADLRLLTDALVAKGLLEVVA